MTRYAENTSVPSDRSRAEIEKTLERYGASSFMYGWDADRAVVQFRMHGRMIRFLLPMPDKNEERFAMTPGGRRRRSSEQMLAAYEQETRSRWRALALVVKAKLEAVESGITDFESEFLAHVLLPDGSTFGAWAAPQIEQAYDKGVMPAMLPGLPAPGESS